MFVERLKRKAESAGATVVESPTRTTRLSQVCHNCRTVAKKPVSQMWHVCECGIIAQRDLYSAFLATCVEGERLDLSFLSSIVHSASPWFRRGCPRLQASS